MESVFTHRVDIFALSQDETLKNVAVIGPQKAAAELEGTRDFSNMISFASVDVLTALPSEQIFDMMTATLIAEKTLDVEMAMTYNFADTKESITIEIRNGIAQLHTQPYVDADIQINTTRAVLNQILIAGPKSQQVIGESLASGKFSFANGDVQAFGLFMSYFDKPMTPQELQLIVR